MLANDNLVPVPVPKPGLLVLQGRTFSSTSKVCAARINKVQHTGTQLKVSHNAGGAQGASTERCKAEDAVLEQYSDGSCCNPDRVILSQGCGCAV